MSTGDRWAWSSADGSSVERYYWSGDPENRLIGLPSAGLAGLLLTRTGATHVTVLRQPGDLTVATGMRDGHRLVALDCLYSKY